MSGKTFLKAVLLVAATQALAGCDWFFGHWSDRPTPRDESTQIYFDAMAAFSDCASSSDPATRAAAVAVLAQADAALASMVRPSNPDHFFMQDRVRAAHGYCAEAAGF